MKRNFLVDLGLESEAIEAIMKEHGKTLNRRIEPLEEERDNLQKDLDARDKQIQEIKDNPQLDPEMQKKLSDFESENTKLKEERKNILLDSAIKVAVAKDAFNPDTVLKVIDRDGLEVEEDGTVKGLDEKLEALKASDAYLFNQSISDETPKEPTETDSNSNGLNPGGQNGNGGKEPDPTEIGKTMAERLLKK